MILFSSLVLSLEVMIPWPLSDFPLEKEWSFLMTTPHYQEEGIYLTE